MDRSRDFAGGPALDEVALANAAAVSPRWVQWRRRIDIGEYDRKFDAMAAAGADVHGEADFLEALQPVRLLDAGCGTGRIAIELHRRGIDVTGVDLDVDMIAAARAKAPNMQWLVDDLARMRLEPLFDVVAMPGNVMIFCAAGDRRLIVQNLAEHLEAGGLLVAGFSLERGGYTLGEWDADCDAAGLAPHARYATWSGAPYASGNDYHVSVHRRP